MSFTRSQVSSSVIRGFSRSILLVLMAFSVLSLAGCKTNPKQNVDYVESFQAGRYAEAYDAAAAAAGRLTGLERDRASLIAGQSAQAINRNDDAEKWLQPLLNNPDSAIAGRAGATLGLVALERGEYAESAELLNGASKKLSADEAARAAMYAGDSYRNLNRPSEARETYVRAQAMVKSDGVLKAQIADRLNNTSPTQVPKSAAKFAVQVGAFSTQAKAAEAAAKFGRFGAVRTIPITSKSGAKLYAVRIGQYATRPEADAQRRRIGADSRVVPTTDE